MKENKAYNQHPWWIILNPKAGNGRAAHSRKAIEHLLTQEGFTYDLVETEYKKHAYQLVETGIKKGYQYIMAIGGDGTNNEVVNGILKQTLVPATQITYTLLPLGTGNDWIRHHGIPANWKKWIPKIATARPILHDAGLLSFSENGKMQERYFVNVAGLAYDAYIAKKKEEGAPAFLTTLYYIWQVVACLFQYKLRRANVRFDNNVITNRFYTINIGICRYSGGGMQFVPHADPQSGKLALTIAGSVSKVAVLLHVPHIFLGKLHRHPEVNIYKTEKVVIEAAEEEPTLVEADGEFLGETPVKCSIVKAALQVLVPNVKL